MKYILSETYRKLAATLLFVLVTMGVMAQTSVTKVSGLITDSRTHQTMPGVSVSFDGTTVGSSADNQGNYRLAGDGNFTRIRVSFIGYKTVYKDITPGTTQTVDIALTEDRQMLHEVVIKSGKKQLPIYMEEKLSDN